jgi:uncharacterized protein (DUF1684 family)
MYLSDLDLAGFRQARDDLFAAHPQSPVPAEDRATFAGAEYFPPNPDSVADVSSRPARGELEIDTGGEDGVITYERVAILDTPWGDLTLFWYRAYGGGRRGTPHTYGAGRYLTDTVKGTFGRGLTIVDGGVRLDFNYAYNPSCAYDERWLCPLAPEENRLSATIAAGELAYHQ